MTRDSQRIRTIQTAAILLFLFIFGITTQGYADSVKSKKNTANQNTTTKIDKNKVILQKKAKSQWNIPYPDIGKIIVSDQVDRDFLKTSEEKKKIPLTEYLDRVIYFYGGPQNVRGVTFFDVKGVKETKSSSPEGHLFHWGPYPPGNRYFEERRISETFKLLQLKREEISKQVVMGFRFSFNPVSGHMFLEMNVTPSFEKGPGFIIPF